jgi:hypothetical protein
MSEEVITNKAIVTVSINSFDWKNKSALDEALTTGFEDDLVEFENLGHDDVYKARLYVNTNKENKDLYDDVYSMCNDSLGEITGDITITNFIQDSFTF